MKWIERKLKIKKNEGVLYGILLFVPLVCNKCITLKQTKRWKLYSK
jgi:hypothetical protein